MPLSTYRVLVRDRQQAVLSAHSPLYAQIQALDITPITGQPAWQITTERLYLLQSSSDLTTITHLAQQLLADPVSETLQVALASTENAPLPAGQFSVEIALLPGVTDNVANELLRAAQEIDATNGLTWAATAQRYTFTGLSQAAVSQIVERLLCNPVIQYWHFGQISASPTPTSGSITPPASIAIRTLDDAQLLALSSERRLSLDIAEMQAIQAYYQGIKRDPTDAELETLAQTWSEHCVHKTFKAVVQLPDGQTVDGLLKTYLRAATDQINAPWVRSAFVDNAGVIDYTDQYELSIKVETHNHPSAIEPFGGANTGVGGVIRDVLGVSHIPIACTDMLCFGPLDTPFAELPAGVLHPQQISQGVVAGIEDYGNKMGLPTVNGAIFYDPGYTANPLVFCGCVGLAPKTARPGTQPQAGDRVIAIGGRTGRDGLRGATFSSMIMEADTGAVAGASVQIGDPITEKGILEVIRLASVAVAGSPLYRAITDCGAGGFSSAVGEMAAELGANINLSTIRTKYPGLAPWELWLSEAQERMVLAVAPSQVPALQAICDRFSVELTDLGDFTGDGQLTVHYDGLPVVNLAMDFLHNGIPRRRLPAQPSAVPSAATAPLPDIAMAALLQLLAHPNIASKQAVIHLYDHEVRGTTVVKPLVGVNHDAPSDAAVLAPLAPAEWRGFALSNGLNPELGKASPHAMAVSAIDEAIRNAVAVGADPRQIAILDNFCWGSPRKPDRMGALLETCQACYTAAVHYGTPFISGKDSLNNEYRDSHGNSHSIPDTLLISALAIVPDVRQAVTMDLKTAGNILFLIGETGHHLQGSHLLLLYPALAESAGLPPTLPEHAPASYRQLHQAIRSGLVRACHDCSEGGLAVAAAEMCIGGQLGLTIELAAIHPDPMVALFSESNGRLLVEVAPSDVESFTALFADLPCRAIGTVTAYPLLVCEPALIYPVAALAHIWAAA
jgi:phosphoribosylformylglycinamidine synthase II